MGRKEIRKEGRGREERKRVCVSMCVWACGRVGVWACGWEGGRVGGGALTST